MIDLKLTYTRELTVRNGNWVLTLHNWMLLMHKCWTTGLYTCIVVWWLTYIVVWSTDVHTCIDDWFTYLYDRLMYIPTNKQTNKQTIKSHLHIFALIRKTTHFQHVTTWTRILLSVQLLYTKYTTLSVQLQNTKYTTLSFQLLNTRYTTLSVQLLNTRYTTLSVQLLNTRYTTLSVQLQNTNIPHSHFSY